MHPPETKMTSQLKIDGWNTNYLITFWGPAYFQGRTIISFRGCIYIYINYINILLAHLRLALFPKRSFEFSGILYVTH